MLTQEERERRDLAFLSGNFASSGPDPEPEEIEPPEGE